MPLTNGLELAGELKKNEELKNIPVYLYSTHLNSGLIQQAQNLGVQGCLEKPSTMADMIKTFKNIFSGEKKPGFIIGEGNGSLLFIEK